MKKILCCCCFLLLATKMLVAQGLFTGTIKYELNYNIPEQGRRAMEKSGFAVTNGMEIAGDGSGLNIKILSTKGVKMEILYTSGFSGFLDRANRVAYKMPERNLATTGVKQTITKTDEFETILGHVCRKYIIEGDDGNKQLVWACPDFKVAYGIYQHISGNSTGDESFAREIDGIPFKVVPAVDKASFEMKTLNIDNNKPENAAFILPVDFKILPYDQVAVGKMLMGEQ